MRLTLAVWLAVALSASAQTGGFGGSSGGSSGRSSGGSSGSSSGSGFSGGSASANANITPDTAIGSFNNLGNSRSGSGASPSNPFGSYYVNPYAQGLYTGTSGGGSRSSS